MCREGEDRGAKIKLHPEYVTVLNDIEWEGKVSEHGTVLSLYAWFVWRGYMRYTSGQNGCPTHISVCVCVCVCVCACVCVCLSENMLIWAYVFVYLNFSQDPTLRVTLTVYCFIKINFIQIHKQMFLKLQIRISFSVFHLQFLLFYVPFSLYFCISLISSF